MRKILSFTVSSKNFKKLYSNFPIEQFVRENETVKWYFYNVEDKVISFVKYFSMEFSIFNANINIKKRVTRLGG